MWTELKPLANKSKPQVFQKSTSFNPKKRELKVEKDFYVLTGQKVLSFDLPKSFSPRTEYGLFSNLLDDGAGRVPSLPPLQPP